MPNPNRPKSAAELRAEWLARNPRVAARLGGAPVPYRPIDLITLGADDAGHPVTIDDTPRLEHAHFIGATGCGKSTALLNAILQDIRRGRGVCVLDPHGGHPGSLINTVLRFLHDHGWLATRKVHIVAPNIGEQIVGFNPLAALPGTDPSVIAGAVLKAFERAWGDEDTLEKPLTRRMLRAIFTVLAEQGLTLADAEGLIDYEDAAGMRRGLIPRIANERARAAIAHIERLSKEPRGLDRFEATVMAPTNRLDEFISNPTLRLMLGQSRAHGARTIDLLDIMNRGHILLVDLQHGPEVDEAGTDLLGKLILRTLFMLMPHRKPYRAADGEQRFHPFFVYVDECHRFMTDDIESLLTQARKFGIGVSLAHQYLAQLGKPSEKIYEAVRNSTEVKLAFRIKSAREAQEIAHDMIPLSLELPVLASIRPVQTGYSIGKLASSSYAVHEGESESEAQHAAESVSQGRTAMQHWMRAHGSATTVGSTTGTGEAEARGSQSGLSSATSHMDSLSYSYDPLTRSYIVTPLPLGMNVGVADGAATANIASSSFQRSASRSRAESQSTSEIASEAEGGGAAQSEAVGRSRGTSKAVSRTRGTSTGRGSSEALLPTYRDMPTTYHSKDNELYFAGEKIRQLPVGRCILRYRSNVVALTIPPPPKAKLR